MRKKSKKPMRRIGPNETSRVIKIDGDGTSTFQPLIGGLALSASTRVGSWRATYEASTFDEPLIVFPGFKMS